MIFPLLISLLVSSSLTKIEPLEVDDKFHSWCNYVGIDVSPSIQLATSPLSVAGRGVFALDTVAKGETLVQIPPHCVFTPKTASRHFPNVAKDLRKRHRRSQGWFNRIFRRNAEPNCWQAELTAYALAVLESDHPWGEWINGWQRDDTVVRLFENGVVSSDEKAVSLAADELQEILPELSQIQLQAAIQIRLQRFEKEERIYLSDENSDSNKRKSIARMHAVLGSRALDLGDDIVGVVPMYDMVNHSLDPNVGFYFNGDNFELFALRDIEGGEELFLCYNEMEDVEKNGWDEVNSMWSLVQWGIPISTKDANDQLMEIHKREKSIE
jgi:hypothetical protein